MTTIKFLGYDLELVAGERYRIDAFKDVVAICVKFNNHHTVFMSQIFNSDLKINIVALYSLIAYDIEDDMTDWVNSLT